MKKREWLHRCECKYDGWMDNYECVMMNWNVSERANSSQWRYLGTKKQRMIFAEREN